MKLLKLSCQQLADFQSALSAIGQAADRLAAGGMPPEISLTLNSTVLRAPSILAEYAEAPAVELEPVAELPDATDALPQSPPLFPAAPPPARPRLVKQERRVATQLDGQKIVKGSFSDDERAKVAALATRGVSVEEIARRLNRRKQAVSSLLANWSKAKPGAPKAAQTASAHTGASGSVPSVKADGAPSPVPEASKPPARAGEMFIPAPDSQTVAIAPPAEAKTPTPPEDLKGEARALWMELNWLRPDPFFDAELDLDLVDGLASGRKLGEIALDLDVDALAAKARFAQLSASIRDGKGNIRLDGQQALLKALRARAMQLRSGAA